MTNFSRRHFGQIAASALAASTVARAQKPTASGPINVIYMHSHDSGRYLSPYGHDVPTPNVMRLAREGMLFRKMHSCAPTCSPSRAALLSGMYAHQVGMLGLVNRGWKMNDYSKHIVHTFKKNGYHTVLAGLQHVAPNPDMIGFDETYKGNNHAAVVAPNAVKFLESKPTKPFFMDVGFIETHRAYPKPTRTGDFILPPAPMPDTPATREDMAGFHACASNFDRGVGMILDAVDKAGLKDNTLIISTTDHGLPWPGMKCGLLDAGIGVSFILRGPGIAREPRVCDHLLSHIDVFPTICDYLGFEKPAHLMGKSFLPLLRGDANATGDDAIFAEVTYHSAYEPKRCVRNERFKYIRRWDHRTTAVLPNCDDSITKEEWIRMGWQKEPLLHEEELYDTYFDPNEHNNIAGVPEHRSMLADLRSRLDRWMHETDDPLLKGPVPLIPGGIDTPVDSISSKAVKSAGEG